MTGATGSDNNLPSEDGTEPVADGAAAPGSTGSTGSTGDGAAGPIVPEENAASTRSEAPTAPDAPAKPPVRRPGGTQAEQDAIFAQLVAQFDDPVDLTHPEWPEIENLRARTERPDPLADFAPQPRPRPAAPGPRDYTPAEDEDEGHFVPPEPPPLPPADTTAKFAWLAVLGGPALLLFDALVWREVSGWPAWVGVSAFLGGFVTLVVRMKDSDEDEPRDPNGGAVV
ncbi:hypothetical protein CFP65_1912 [Kitasatospora sp. MMS16-BH015]|uniref:hypothetical protein n=1 Tax=Kitasatospora sp. MMS16-BH015 TaxID=2018025 RepID=UPI000CA0BBE9|nr:hypothetical protein [Kitasatospora sp. MMS16-BH015]AUG76781.1 hypothetical protein CFP65_1912 [Kitasatospora sp. MMS16-BH015]